MAAAKKSDGVKDFVASLGAKRACKYVESVNALCETRAEKDGAKALQKRLLAVSENATSAYGGGGVDG